MRAQGPGGYPGGAGGRPTNLFRSFLYNFCSTISTCLNFVCCCWLLEECYPRPYGPHDGPPTATRFDQPGPPYVGPVAQPFGLPAGPPDEDPATRFPPPPPPPPAPALL